jgi:hypothetical protein
MDVDTVRDHADQHGRAVVAGDLKRAGSDIATEAQGDAPGVLAAIPKVLESADVVDVVPDGDDALATITYSGEGRDVQVQSRWSERDGRPMIVGLKLL